MAGCVASARRPITSGCRKGNSIRNVEPRPGAPAVGHDVGYGGAQVIVAGAHGFEQFGRRLRVGEARRQRLCEFMHQRGHEHAHRAHSRGMGRLRHAFPFAALGFLASLP